MVIEPSKPILRIENVHQTYGVGEAAVSVLRGANLEIGRGETVALVGPSGSGKSTLLHIAGLLEQPTAGQVYFFNSPTSGLNDNARTGLRRRMLGFVYQFHHLLPELSALENVMLPQQIAGKRLADAQMDATELLRYLGLEHRLNHLPSTLSGGEQQRVAVARALANNPRLVLADEPTGNLDPKTAEHVIGLFLDLVKSTGISLLIATHDMNLAQRLDRRISVVDGVVVEV